MLRLSDTRFVRGWRRSQCIKARYYVRHRSLTSAAHTQSAALSHRGSAFVLCARRWLPAKVSQRRCLYSLGGDGQVHEGRMVDNSYFARQSAALQTRLESAPSASAADAAARMIARLAEMSTGHRPIAADRTSVQHDASSNLPTPGWKTEDYSNDRQAILDLLIGRYWRFIQRIQI